MGVSIFPEMDGLYMFIYNPKGMENPLETDDLGVPPWIGNLSMALNLDDDDSDKGLISGEYRLNWHVSSDNTTYHHLYLEDEKIILDDFSESTPIVLLWMVAKSYKPPIWDGIEILVIWDVYKFTTHQLVQDFAGPPTV